MFYLYQSKKMYGQSNYLYHPHVTIAESFINDDVTTFQHKLNNITIDINPIFYNGLLLMLRDKLMFLFIVNKKLGPDDWQKLMLLRSKSVNIFYSLSLACEM
jgi:hypothetical protein